MRYLPIFILALVLGLSACSLDDNNDSAETWAEANVLWLAEQAQLKNPDGSLYFERISPVWVPSATVLMHWYNDRQLTAGNLVPLSTSTVTVKYHVRLYNGVAVDSSYMRVDSVWTTKVSNVIDGFGIALQQMHVGDSVRVIIPYTEGYGAAVQGNIPAYSNLDFRIKLVDVAAYEIP